MMVMSHQPEATREAILDAAEKLFGRFGYRKTTVQEIAEEAKIGKGTVYLHFESKESVALSTIDRLIQRVVDRLEAIAASEEPAGERIRAMLVERVMIRFDGVQDYSSRIDELLSQIRNDLLLRRRYYFQAEAAILARVLKQGRASGEVETESPMATARAMIAATNSLLPYDLSARELGRRVDVERQVREVVDLILEGVLARTYT
jgi:AcrR family transcriptional regulator